MKKGNVEPQAKSTVQHDIALGAKWEECQEKLDKRILTVIRKEFAYESMAPVQENCIPLLLQNKDLVVEACTGSGKTMAYLVPAFEMFLRKVQPSVEKDGDPEYNNGRILDKLFSLIICPTRELAIQVFEKASVFVNCLSSACKAWLITGGNQQSSTGAAFLQNQQIRNGGGDNDDSFDNAGNNSSTFITASSGTVGHHVIAIVTPGRFLDFLLKTPQNRVFTMVKSLELLILDEADRILDMGFQEQVNQILQKLPKQRRTALFSATQTSDMRDFIRSGLRNPVRIHIKSKQATPQELTNYYMECEQDERLYHLIQFLHKHSNEKVIVYFLTCNCVSYFIKLVPELMKQLYSSSQNCSQLQSTQQSAQLSFQIYGLHGKMVQKKRTATYNEFTQAASGVLFATDVAARGLDFPNVHYILQYDAPRDPNVFIHRVGRTARMGKIGVSLIFLSKKELHYVEYLRMKKVPIEEITQQAFHTNTIVTNGEDIANKNSDGDAVIDEENGGDESEDEEDAVNEEEEEDGYKDKKVGETLGDIQEQELYKMGRELVKYDLDLVEKGMDAFVSFVRAYKEHQLSYIFKLSELNLNQLARAYCLIAKPKIWRREFKRMEFELDEPEVDISALRYKDQKREKARQERVKKQRLAEKNKKNKESKEKNCADDKQQDSSSGGSDDDDDGGDSDNFVKREKLFAKKQQIRKDNELNTKEKKRMYERFENEEVKKDARLLRLLKLGKINEEQYEEMSGLNELEKMFGLADNKPTSSTGGAHQQKRKKRRK